jgi:kinesin family protein 5
LGQEDVETIAVKLLFSCNVVTSCVDSLNQKYTLAHQQMQQDYERLKQEENDKSNKLQELM